MRCTVAPNGSGKESGDISNQQHSLRKILITDKDLWKNKFSKCQMKVLREQDFVSIFLQMWKRKSVYIGSKSLDV